MMYDDKKEALEKRIRELMEIDCKDDYLSYELEILELGIEAKEKELSVL